MTEGALVIPQALELLATRIAMPPDPNGLSQVLRALQRLGLSETRLQVYLERMRAINELQDKNKLIDANCQLALDIISGLAGTLSLTWDASHRAQVLLPRVLDPSVVAEAIDYALARSDLLPPRVMNAPSVGMEASLARDYLSVLNNDDFLPARAVFFRVPKVSFTTRAAALLSPWDRISWEALACLIQESLESKLDTAVIWPRSRSHVGYSQFTEGPVSWSDSYIVRTDIESFYESIDHSILAVLLSRTLGAGSTYAQAVEALLDAVMGSPVGLPQGPPASEIFASAFLVLVDEFLSSSGIEFYRYADDYAIAASSVLDGRRKLERLETVLREIGLRLNPRKTRILKKQTYKDNADIGHGRLDGRLQRLRSAAIDDMLAEGNEELISDKLSSWGAREEELWNVFYHNTLSLADVVANIKASPPDALVSESYAALLMDEAAKLRNGDFPEDESVASAEIADGIAHLAGASLWIERNDILTFLSWYPSLAPTISLYVQNTATSNKDEARQLLLAWLTIDSNTDWVQAWACAAIEALPQLVAEELETALSKILTSSNFGLLTRAGAARALAAARRLPAAAWLKLYEDSPSAIQSEMYIDTRVDPEAYAHVDDNGPWDFREIASRE